MRAKARAFWGMRVLRDRGAGHKRFRVGGRLLGGLSTACRLRANGEADHDRGENEEARRRHACEAAGARGGLCLLGQSEGADRRQVHLDARRRDAGELWARPPAEALVLLAALAAAVCFFELDADAVDALRAAALRSKNEGRRRATVSAWAGQTLHSIQSSLSRSDMSPSSTPSISTRSQHVYDSSKPPPPPPPPPWFHCRFSAGAMSRFAGLSPDAWYCDANVPPVDFSSGTARRGKQSESHMIWCHVNTP